MLLLVHNIQF